jgi:hypothetical protein
LIIGAEIIHKKGRPHLNPLFHFDRGCVCQQLRCAGSCDRRISRRGGIHKVVWFPVG